MGAKVRLLVMISGSVSGSALFRNSRVENKEKSLVTKIKTFYKLPYNKQQVILPRFRRAQQNKIKKNRKHLKTKSKQLQRLKHH